MKYQISVQPVGARWPNRRPLEQERRVKGIQQKLDRLEEAFLYSESIDLTSYSRQRDKLREELTLAQIDRHTGCSSPKELRTTEIDSIEPS